MEPLGFDRPQDALHGHFWKRVRFDRIECRGKVGVGFRMFQLTQRGSDAILKNIVGQGGIMEGIAHGVILRGSVRDRDRFR